MDWLPLPSPQPRGQDFFPGLLLSPRVHFLGFLWRPVPNSPHRVVVGAPQEIKTANQTGGLYQCDYSTSACEPIQLQGEPPPSLSPGALLCISLPLPGIPFSPVVLGGGSVFGAPRGSAPSLSQPRHAQALLSYSFPTTRCPLDLPACVSWVEVTPVQLLLRPFPLLNVTMHMPVLSVPPEAVNMSLGLSLAFATNPFRLLVSRPWVTGVSEGRRGDLGLLGLASCRGWRCWGKRTGSRGQPLLPAPCLPGLRPHPTPNVQGEHLCERLLLPVWIQPAAAAPEVPKGPQR